MKIRLAASNRGGWVVALLVALIALMVGLILVYKLFQMASRLLGDPPPDSPTNTIQSSVWLTNGLTPQQMEALVSSALSSKPPAAGFTLYSSNSPCTFTFGYVLGQGGPRFQDPATFAYLNPDTSATYPVQVLRSTNLEHWQAIATNWVGLEQGVIFSDSMAPCAEAFYRLLQ